MIKTTTKMLYSSSVTLGSGAGKIVLDNSQILSLFHLCTKDIGWIPSDFNLTKLVSELPSDNYFKISLDWFETHTPPSSESLMLSLQKLIDKDSDFGLYFKNLCELHKRRIKYQSILSEQSKPTMEQIGPRGLLEYGFNGTELLANWMIWRKWIYDIDNRSGQETGYLFEPILASCLGGTPISSSKSPVKRIGEDGKPKSGGRQIDCYDASENIAYEFKLRVTIAASGQGRFSEEISFPHECQAAGIKPILLVLDSTPSHRLKDLSNAFSVAGGLSYIGDDAWNHMEKKAGQVISVFIEKYIRTPLLNIANSEKEKLPSINLSWTDESIIVSDGNEEYKITRE